MDAHLLLDDGVLRLDPLNFGVAGGDIRSTIRMDARQAQIRTALRASVRGVQLGQLFPDAKLAEQAKGGIGGEVDLSGRGNSIAAMLGSSSGKVGLAMGRGHVGNLVMELAGLDITESLKFLVTGDKQIPLRCAFADFGVQDGLMTSQALAVDTTDTILIGEGTVSLRDETLDLLLNRARRTRASWYCGHRCISAARSRTRRSALTSRRWVFAAPWPWRWAALPRRQRCWLRLNWGRARMPTAVGSMRSRVTALFAAPPFPRVEPEQGDRQDTP